MAGKDQNKEFIDSLDIQKGKKFKKPKTVTTEAEKPVILNLGGRPPVYSKELADAICARLAMGESLRSVCRDESMPAAATIFKWMREIDGFLKQYETAKAESADAMSEDCLDISDNQVEQPLLIDGIPMLIDGKMVMIKDAVSVAHARLRVDTRKWLMAKMKPKKYGDKIELASDPLNPLTVTKIEIVAPKA
jgi:hypothetical protein